MIPSAIIEARQILLLIAVHNNYTTPSIFYTMYTGRPGTRTVQSAQGTFQQCPAHPTRVRVQLHHPQTHPGPPQKEGKHVTLTHDSHVPPSHSGSPCRAGQVQGSMTSLAGRDINTATAARVSSSLSPLVYPNESTPPGNYYLTRGSTPRDTPIHYLLRQWADFVSSSAGKYI